MTSPAEKYEIAVEKSRLRQAKFYAKNKDKLSEKKKLDRKVLKNCKERVDDVPCSECAIAEAEAEAEKEVIIPKKIGKAIAENEEQLTLEIVLKKLNEIALIEVKGGKPRSPKTMSSHASNIKAYFRISGCKVLNECLLHPEIVLERIENALQPKSNTPYSTNTKKSYIHSLLLVLDYCKNIISTKLKDEYREYAGIMVAKSETEKEVKDKELDSAVIMYSDYVKKVLEKCGKDSKEYLYAAMYDECPCRDDFQLGWVKTMDETTNKNMNYLVMSDKGKGTIVLQKYKTSGNKEKPVVVDLSTKVSKLIRTYMLTERLSYGMKLFPTKNSKFVVQMSKKIGIDNAGINYLRHSIITERNKKGMTPAERYRLAEIMGHQSGTQLTYIRPVKE